VTRAPSHDLEVLHAPELPLAAQSGGDDADLRSWYLPPLAPGALLVRARGYKESVECGQDGPVPTDVADEALRAMPELSLRRQAALGRRALVPGFAPAPLPQAGGGAGVE